MNQLNCPALSPKRNYLSFDYVDQTDTNCLQDEGDQSCDNNNYCHSFNSPSVTTHVPNSPPSLSSRKSRSEPVDELKLEISPAFFIPELNSNEDDDEVWRATSSRLRLRREFSLERQIKGMSFFKFRSNNRRHCSFLPNKSIGNTSNNGMMIRRRNSSTALIA